MKKILFACALLTMLVVVLTSFKKEEAAPKLYPELEAYFKSLDPKQFDKAHLESLNSIKDDVNFSNMDYAKWNIVFYCSENSFRSQASQVFLQTLCYAKKHRRVHAFSASKMSTEISPRLIGYLSRIGYRINKVDKNGTAVYEVRFSDNADPVVLFSKKLTDKSLPASNIASVIVCDTQKEINCKDIQTASSSPVQLPFEKITDSDTDTKADKILKSIATEMVYVTQKKN